MIITVTGKPGSGKSTLARELAKKFKLKHHSAGEFMRAIAKEKNMTLLELSAKAETDTSIDREIDERTKKFGQTHDNFVIDSRLAWHFIPNSIKIFLDIDAKEAARRIYSHTLEKARPDEKENTTIKQTMENAKKREESEHKRYKKLYGISYNSQKNFDIVIDTTNSRVKETFEKASKELEKIIQKKSPSFPRNPH